VDRATRRAISLPADMRAALKKIFS